MPRRIDGISRRRFCLFMILARRQSLRSVRKATALGKERRRPALLPRGGDGEQPLAPKRGAAVVVPADVASFCGAALSRKRANRKLQSLRNRMLCTHSLRALTRSRGDPSLWSFWDRNLDFIDTSDEDGEDDDFQDALLPCGLGVNEAMSMMHRELTPEDYEKLCKLDENIPKHGTLQQGQVDCLPRFRPGSSGVECKICLSEIDRTTEAVKLPCSHAFHVPCITRWLTQCKNSCPLCSAEIAQPVATPAVQSEPI
eukprot:TRINITY_DN41475_c0_g1_i1.p1 TRINITY_DN41475_c0_g1~~TRINITY_DN41475_c0_g1_i1.p1  ORF type:complete len:256 (-),score=42.36 TRINITY_DN41475_c0_g1_i1:83-850(-)